MALDWNLKDNVNAYTMQEDGSFIQCASPTECGDEAFNIHKKFFEVNATEVMEARLFQEEEMIEEALGTEV